jgi:hypothetical protein
MRLSSNQLIFLLVGTCLCLGGCAHREKDKPEGAEYTPVNERPPPASEYWQQRGKQDEMDRRIEERNRGR